MSLLPQRKKSAEEIAKLRESLGIPGSPVPEQETSPPIAEIPAEPVIDTLLPDSHQAVLVHPPEAIPLTPPEAPAIPTSGPKPVHSLKRSERAPILHDEEEEEEDFDEASHASAPEPLPVQAAHRLPKPVRSLKKSEQTPVLTVLPVAEPTPSSKIPFHRHSDKEIEEIRRREALALLNVQKPNPKLAAAHFAILIPGYLLAIAGASCFLFYEVTAAVTGACEAAALLIAAFIFMRRPISRHHGAFIAVIALLVIVFGAIHFFPQLQHAT
jgi:hypothetical protein